MAVELLRVTKLGLWHLYQYLFCCGILKIVGTKKQDFWPKINMLKRNHCVLRKGAPVRQKLGMILENEVVQKLKLYRGTSFVQVIFVVNVFVDYLG